MTEQETFTAMLTRAGITYDTERADQTRQTEVNGATVVTIAFAGERTGARVGYSGFYTEFVFNEAGALVQVGTWE